MTPNRYAPATGAREQDGGLWRASVLLGALASPLVGFAGDVVINEIHYEPADKTSREELIELHNPTDHEVDVSGWFFSSGVDYQIPAGTRIAGQGYLVIAEDPATLLAKHSFAGALGPFTGSLSNEGEGIVLRNAAGGLEDEVDYGVGFPWPLASAGGGSSMELIQPLLDNNLGGSWRASGIVEIPRQERISYLDAEATGWRYRRGVSEPPAAWRDPGFPEDASWLVGQTSIGFGDDDDNTVLDDMLNSYNCVYLRRRFTVPADQVPAVLKLDLYVDDGAVVWINGVEVLRDGVAPGPPPAFNSYATRSIEPSWASFLLPNPTGYIVPGENLIAIQVLNRAVSSGDVSIDVRLYRPANDDVQPTGAAPSPGRANSVLAENASPQIRQVDHALATPSDQQSNRVTARVSDPDGVASVRLFYQVVLPGQYIPSHFPVPLPTLLANARAPRPPNPAFEDPANWVSLEMHDDGSAGDTAAGDELYTAVVPAQMNRSLVRYRIEAVDPRGQGVRVPYVDDPSLNFAYLVYNGVPDYSVATSILGEPTTYPAATLQSLPVYFLITRPQDLIECIAPNAAQQIDQSNAARSVENWEGAWVYDGLVYDHIRYRLRGGNGRYQNPEGNAGNVQGKRKYKLDFNRGKHFQARDRLGQLYPVKWEAMNIGRMFGNRIDGNWSLSEQVNDLLWSAYGVPAPSHHSFHFRVVDGAEEAPAGATGQYLGDFWGIAHAFEYYDGAFLEARGLPKGNLYKLSNRTDNGLEQLRYQAPFAVSNAADHNNIEASLRPTQSDAWLHSYVGYESWYRYHAIVQAVRHYDYWPSANKNAAWYFYPSYTQENRMLGQLWTLPDDTDATWGPNWNSGIDRQYESIFGPPAHAEMQKDYRNHIREVRDLLWQKDQLELAIRYVAAFLDPLEEADIDRWRNAPPAAGRQYFAAPGQRNLEGKFQDMMRFAFTGGSWPDQPVGAGGRAAFLDQFADSPHASQLPTRPTITYRGPVGYPMDQLELEASAFSDPQGPETFKAMKWRVAAVSDIADPGTRPLTDPLWTAEPVRLEITPTWESEEIAAFEPLVTLPLSAIEPGRKYRVRVRMQDQTNLWSHWSAPLELTVGQPSQPLPVVQDLRVTEIMYNPLDGNEFEFLELQNTGEGTLDVSALAIEGGIAFNFASSEVQSLGPGEIVVLVNDRKLFELRHGKSARIAGVYSGNLSNGGERILIRYHQLTVMDFTYDDDWEPLTDGGGHSLNAVDVRAPAEAWSRAANWFSSSVEGGTPGAVDPGTPGGSLSRPGDGNADGRLNIGDPVALMLLLFAGDATRPLPCAGPLTSGSNLALLDENADGKLDVADVIHLLTYLFRAGPPHALGSVCTVVEGCSGSCRS